MLQSLYKSITITSWNNNSRFCAFPHNTFYCFTRKWTWNTIYTCQLKTYTDPRISLWNKQQFSSVLF